VNKCLNLLKFCIMWFGNVACQLVVMFFSSNIVNTDEYTLKENYMPIEAFFYEHFSYFVNFLKIVKSIYAFCEC